MAKAKGSFQITSFNEDTYEDRGRRREADPRVGRPGVQR